MARPGTCRSRGGEAETSQGTPGLMGCEIGPIKPGHQGQDLLRRPPASVDHYEVLMDGLGQRALECFLHAPGVKIIRAARHRHRWHARLRFVFSEISSLIRLYEGYSSGSRNTPSAPNWP